MFKLIFKCFYDKNAYVEVSRKKYNLFAFFVLITFLVMIPETLKFNHSLGSAVKKTFYPMADEFPEVHISGGKMTYKDPSMEGLTAISFPGGTGFLIVDPDSDFSDLSLDERDRNPKIFLLSNGFATKKANSEIRFQVYPATFDSDINTENIKQFLDAYPVISVIYYFLGGIGTYVGGLFWGFVFYILGLIISKGLDLKFPKLNLFYVALLATVPATIIKAFVFEFLELPNFNFIYLFLLISFIYLCVNLFHINSLIKKLEEKKTDDQ